MASGPSNASASNEDASLEPKKKIRETLSTLPSEVLELIVGQVGLATLSSLLLVNRRLKDETLAEFWRQLSLTRLDSLRVARYLDYVEWGPGILAPPRKIRSVRFTGIFDASATRNLARLFKNHASELRVLDLTESRGLDVLRWGPTNDHALERMVAASGAARGQLRTLLMPRQWFWRFSEMVYMNIPEYQRLVETPERKLALYDWVEQRLGSVLAEKQQQQPLARPLLAEIRELGITLDIWSIDDLGRMLEAWERLGVNQERLRTLCVTTRNFVGDFFLTDEVGFYDPIPSTEPVVPQAVFSNLPAEPFSQEAIVAANPVPTPPARPVRRYPFLASLTSLTVDFNPSRDELKDATIASGFLLETLVRVSKSLKSLTILGIEWLDSHDLVLPETLKHLDLKGCGMTVSQWKKLFEPTELGAEPLKLKSLSIDCTALHIPYPRALEDDLDDPDPSPAWLLEVLSGLDDLDLYLQPIKFAGVIEDPVHRFPRKIIAHLEVNAPNPPRLHLHLAPSLPWFSPQLLQAHVQLLSPLFPTPSSADMVRSVSIAVQPPIRVPHMDLLADCHSRFPKCDEFAVFPEGAAETWSGDSALWQLVRDRGCGDARVEGGGLRGGGGLLFSRVELERLLSGPG
jgi:hypothetical protein